MAVPKKATSKSRRDMRRSHHAITGTTLIHCPNCNDPVKPHRICPSCGHYRGKEIVKGKEEE